MIKPPTLSDLPAPPSGKHGWPWDEASPPLDGGKIWPSISIITPSYNQGHYIEETIRSVLLQGYPALEYFIIDGGSTDDTVEIIRKYEPWLSGWVSEKDKGQSDAINKGFARCTSEIFNWICSDDVLTNGALRVVGSFFTSSKSCDVLAGACYCQYDKEPERSGAKSGFQEGWVDTPYVAGIWQPSCFYRRNLVERPDFLRRDLHYCMDRELWCYFFRRGAQWMWTDEVLSHYRFTGENKSVTGGGKIIDEIARIFREYQPKANLLTEILKNAWLPVVLARFRSSSTFAGITLGIASRSLSAALLLIFPAKHVRALQKEFFVYSVW